MLGSIDMERKGCESKRCWTHYVTLSYDLDLRFSRSNLKKLYPRNGRVDWHGTKGMWVYRTLDPHCGFESWPHPWPWPWIFKVKFCRGCISGTWRSIDMERKGCESIGCWTHDVNWDRFSGSNLAKTVSQQWEPVGPICWPINGLPILWSRAEGCRRSLNALLYML